MNVLIIGSGGREHALAWKIAQSSHVEKLFCIPGNAGIEQIAILPDVSVLDFDALIDFAQREEIGITIVGPEAPLAEGIVDRFQEVGLRIFGPPRDAARLESSKIFAKEVMTKAGVPTASYQVFNDSESAIAWLAMQSEDHPWVVKADGLAAGKGVFICDNRVDALNAVQAIMIDREYGAAGDRILIEERLEGYEVSLLAICSGQDALPLAPAQDYKRIGDGDTGPNTGGMGNYSPVPEFSSELIDFGLRQVIAPTLQEVPFVGTLFVGLMVTPDGPKVLEYNVRFGDPETEVVLPRMQNDLLEIILAAVDGRLRDITPQWSIQKAVTVVLAAGGYPGDYQKGNLISGLEAASALPGVIVFHAGTRTSREGIVTNGGRVLDVTALGDTFAEAIDRAYTAVSHIRWDDMTFRRDIADRVRER